ncbi:rhomboid family intramembrane serine protease GlpG [Thaumasiovibrio subtropicus]|uniref:rhomboid family intramembrane serine protease GlpG n=1 Tax=Thaumasiovibrio subtropicus TaxID=1891207 RepID=UPI000B354F02|nr:rhomboid family intramembrane serine protease GlpG [Thaumasiovibrio subtropicus]
MIKFFVIDNLRIAQAFVDYCDSRQLKVLIQPEPEGLFSLWIADAAQQIEIEAELKRFVAEPDHPRYREASWDMAESRPTYLRATSPSLLNMIKQGAGPFTLLIMLLCSGIYILSSWQWQQPIFQLLHFPVNASQWGEVWRWVSHAVMHFSTTHIIFNLLWWWILGGKIEKIQGSGRLMLLFMVSAVLSGLGQFLVTDAFFGGLSGVVYALMGYCWWLGWLLPERGIQLEKHYVGFMLLWIVLGYIQPFIGIANTAHLVGLMSGCGLAALSYAKSRL